VLEIGCGPGANLWYLAREGFAAHGIDGSAVALAQARKRLGDEGLAAGLVCGDAMRLPWPDDHFDAVLDVECVYANVLADARRILGEARRVLRPGGRLFSKTFATGTSGEGSGPRVGGEPNTYRDLRSGHFNTGYGVVRFTAEAEIPDLYGGFEDLAWEVVTRSFDGRRGVVREWVITARKAGDQGGATP
jgi:SAM-dependent methyltransferase